MKVDLAIQFGCKPPEAVDLLKEAKKAAQEADAVILVIGTNSDWETEGNDRADLGLPANQDELVDAVLAENKNTVVVINSGSPVSMPWKINLKQYFNLGLAAKNMEMPNGYFIW